MCILAILYSNRKIDVELFSQIPFQLCEFQMAVYKFKKKSLRSVLFVFISFDVILNSSWIGIFDVIAPISQILNTI